MGRNFTGSMFGTLATLAIAVAPAEGKDRKSATRDSGALAERLTTREARAVLTSRGSESATMERKPNGKPTAPLADQQEIRSNPFRFNIGAVAVQPAVGGIKGAQFSIGF